MALVLADANIEPVLDYVTVGYWSDGYSLELDGCDVEATGNYLKLFEANIEPTADYVDETYADKQYFDDFIFSEF